jgi:hypothetical protein
MVKPYGLIFIPQQMNQVQRQTSKKTNPPIPFMFGVNQSVPILDGKEVFPDGLMAERI